MRLSEDEAIGAWQRIFMTADGRTALRTLVSVVQEVMHGDASALQEHNGRRSFAAQLVSLAAMEPVNEIERKQNNDFGRKSRRHGPAGR